jgi:hypothetical protein
VWPGGKANHPLLGFPLPPLGCVHRVEGEGWCAIAAPRRWGKERARRRARDHGCERPNGRHTPVPSRVVRFSRRMLSLGIWHLNRAPAAHRAVAAPREHFVEHLLGERTGSAGLKEGAGRRPGLGPKPS